MTNGLGNQILLTLAVLVGAVIVRSIVSVLMRLAAGRGWQRREGARPQFWVKQATSLALLVAVVAARSSIWVADAGRFAAIAGLITAGVAVSLQRVLTSFAACLRAESILLDAARRHTAEYVEKATPALEELRKHYVLALEIASATYEIVGVPPLRVDQVNAGAR